MSALDKAFIKAYTKDPSPPAAGREDPGGPGPRPLRGLVRDGPRRFR